MVDLRLPRVWSLVAITTLVIAASSCSRSVPTAEWTTNITPGSGPAGSNSSLPQLTTSDRGSILSWIEQSGESTATLKFSEWNGSRWSAAQTIASGDRWFLSYADPPHVLRRADGTLVANWLVSTNPQLEGSDLHISYSRDDGRTWASSFLPHHDGTQGQHAFPSFFEMPDNRLGVVWVDARAQAADPEDIDASYSLRYAAFDSSWKLAAEGEIDPKTCECCSTSAAVTADGVLVAFRDRSDDEIRDIGVSRFENGRWTTTTIVHGDNFETFSCPVNGPMLSARGTRAVVAWFTVKNDQGQAWAAFSDDSGRSWGAPVRLDDAGSLGRVDVELLDDGTAIASWVEFADRRGQFRVRRIDASGTKSQPVTVAGVEGSGSSGFPRMTRQGDQLVFTWTESETKPDNSTVFQVRTATAPLGVN